jgi:hypothetical protein
MVTADTAIGVRTARFIWLMRLKLIASYARYWSTPAARNMHVDGVERTWLKPGVPSWYKGAALNGVYGF